MTVLTITKEKYPYHFFKESAFHAGHVENILAQTYVEYSQRGIVSASHLSQNPELYLLGSLSNIMDKEEVLNEDSFEGYLQNLCHEFNGDLWKVVDTLGSQGYMMSMSPEYMELLERDIRVAFNRMNMFHLRAGSYETLTFFAKQSSHPYSEKMLDKLFANIPIVRTW